MVLEYIKCLEIGSQVGGADRVSISIPMAGQGVTTGSMVDGSNPLLEPICLFLLQVMIIISLSRALGYFFSYVKQPAVIAEVIGGIILGPTFLSRFPAFKDTVFPQESLPKLQLVSEFGLILYLFLVGMELDPMMVVKTFKKSAVISVTGIVLPFSTGVGVSKLIYDTYIGPDVDFTSFVVFCGVAMSITSFPVLARILAELNLFSTVTGQYTIAAAVFDDAIAWILLVWVVALINNPTKGINALYVFLIVVAFALFLWFVVKPLFQKVVRRSKSDSGASQFNVFIILSCMVLSSWFTQAIGVHSIFGAFMIGLIVPHEKGFAIAMTEKVEDLVSILFLPLYFAYSGLNTQLGELADPQAWLFVLLVFTTACGGKIVGCTLAARFTKLPWRQSFVIGILMNTKGLMEIIVLNLGLRAGVITPKVFAIFLLMALLTTFMTVPLVSWLYPPHRHVPITKIDDNEKQTNIKDESDSASISRVADQKYSMLVCLPEIGTVNALMKFTQLLSDSKQRLDLWGLRMIELEDRRNSKVMMVTESVHMLKYDPVVVMFRSFCDMNKIDLRATLSAGSVDTHPEDVVDACEIVNFDLCLCPVSISNSSYPDGWENAFVEALFAKCPVPVAILLDRGYGANEQAIMPTAISIAHFNTDAVAILQGNDDESELLSLLQIMAENPSMNVTIHAWKVPIAILSTLNELGSNVNVKVESHASELNTTVFDSNITGLDRCDLVMISQQTYAKGGKSATSLKTWLNYKATASVMILRDENMVVTSAPSMFRDASSAGFRQRKIVKLPQVAE